MPEHQQKKYQNQNQESSRRIGPRGRVDTYCRDSLKTKLFLMEFLYGSWTGAEGRETALVRVCAGTAGHVNTGT